MLFLDSNSSFTKVNINKALEKIEAKNAVTSLFFISKKHSEKRTNYEVIRSRATKEVLEEFRLLLFKKLFKFCEDSNLKINSYDPFYMSDRSSLEFLPVDKIPKLWETFISSMSKTNELEYPNKIDSEFLKQLWAYAIRVSVNGQSFYFFRKYSRGKVIQSGGPLNFFFSGGVLSKLEEDVLYFDEKIDSIVIEKYMLILQKNLFEQMFSFTEAYQALADTALQQLQESNLLSNFGELEAACKSDPLKIKKLAWLSQQNINFSALDRNKIKQIATEWKVDLQFDNSNKIVLERRSVWGLLKLLSDDLLRSPLTQFKYEVQSKERRS